MTTSLESQGLTFKGRSSRPPDIDPVLGHQLSHLRDLLRLRLPAMVDAFQTPPRGPGRPCLLSVAAMSRGDLALR